MTLLFWVSLAVIAYTYAGYPIVMALLARIAAKPWRKAPFHGSVSIIMAVHNGGEKTAPQLDHLLSIEPDLVKQVIVVSDGSTDSTAATITGSSLVMPTAVRIESIEKTMSSVTICAIAEPNPIWPAWADSGFSPPSSIV